MSGYPKTELPRNRKEAARSSRDRLIQQALEAQKMAYDRYSHFKVGAALLVRDGRMFLGCNVENAAFNPTVHAEQTAVVSAIAQGVRPNDLIAIAVVGPAETPITPCGICRQFLAEFSPPEDPIVIWCCSADTLKIIETNLAELLPHQFPSPQDLVFIGR